MMRVCGLALLVTAACASTRGTEVRGGRVMESERAAVADAQSQSEALENDLASLSATGEPPRCERACDLVARICELADRICAISGRHAGDEDLSSRCSAAEQRCRRSRDRVAQSCACTPR